MLVFCLLSHVVKTDFKDDVLDQQSLGESNIDSVIHPYDAVYTVYIALDSPISFYARISLHNIHIRKENEVRALFCDQV